MTTEALHLLESCQMQLLLSPDNLTEVMTKIELAINSLKKNQFEHTVFSDSNQARNVSFAWSIQVASEYKDPQNLHTEQVKTFTEVMYNSSKKPIAIAMIFKDGFSFDTHLLRRKLSQ